LYDAHHWKSVARTAQAPRPSATGCRGAIATIGSCDIGLDASNGVTANLTADVIVYTDERDTLKPGFPDLKNRAFVVNVNRLLHF
jgi:hypothetical protein